MRIETVKIPANMFDDNIRDVNMSRLKEVVIIAGRNGSGKTRLLKRIKECVSRYCSQSTYENILSYISREEKGKLDSQERYELNKEYEKIYVRHHEIIKIEDEPDNEITLNNSKYFKVVEFVPNSFDYADPRLNSQVQIAKSYEQCKKLGINSIGINTFIYIHYICEKYIYATNPSTRLEDSKVVEAKHLFDSLNNLIYQFLGANLSWSAKNEITIFDIPLGESNLSLGQKVLLQFCVAMHAQGGDLDNVILFLDEPENHLHPAALISFIKTIIGKLKKGQVWIATHSIHVMSFLDPSYIWYIVNGEISYAGRSPEDVLKGLLGDEEQIEKMQTFMHLPAVLASIRFSAECLMPPGVADAIIGDKQTNHIRQIINSQVVGEQVRILDYGAGKGRLIDEFFYTAKTDERDTLRKRIDYIAFDEYPCFAETCKDAISRMYGSAENRYFSTETNIKGNINSASCDVAILCNVLHEIPPEEWLSKLGESSLIYHLLKETGYLLLVEDMLMPIGEKPHQKGYFVLGINELKQLFSIPPECTEITPYSADDKRRLMAYLVPKRHIKNITKDTIGCAIKTLHDHAKEEIESIRKKSDYKSGNIYAYWTHQLANTILYLENQ